MRKLSLDISTFSELIQSNYLYVDKTEYAYKLVTTGRRFFLSRPRRFGKSLFVSTLKEVLRANKGLFDGLWIGQSDYEWKQYGVIDLDFSKLEMDSVEIFEKSLINTFIKIGETYNIFLDSKDKTVNIVFEDLVIGLHQQFGRVAVLVDEYDNPILHTLNKQDLAISIRDKIQKLFTTIKSLDAKIQFAFITGVSSFAKAGLFSGINNLQIITLRNEYAAICGYTDEEIDHYFKEYSTRWLNKDGITYDQLRQKIRSWYNGYHFGKDVTAVYNPFSVMNALNIEEFENFWFQSGTPTFLVELLKTKNYPLDLEKLEASKDFLGMFDVGNIPAISLMFQAGYLTIVGYDAELELYKLDYPNEEIRTSFQKYLIEVFAHIPAFDADRMSKDLRAAFAKENIEEIIELLRQLFAHIPYQIQMKAEKYYHSLFIMICIGAGIKAQSEYSTSHGRIDLILEFPKLIYVIEVKFNDTAKKALQQIEERKYFERFIKEGKKIILLGLAFKREPNEFDVTYVMKEIASR